MTTLRGSLALMVNPRNLSAGTEVPVGPFCRVYQMKAEPVGRQRSGSYSRSRPCLQQLLAVTNGRSDFRVDLRKRLIVVGSKSP